MLNFSLIPFFFLFFFNDTATTEIYTLSLHDALPIWPRSSCMRPDGQREDRGVFVADSERPHAETAESSWHHPGAHHRSEEHTSELQSLAYLVCRLLLEKKKKIKKKITNTNQNHNILY